MPDRYSPMGPRWEPGGFKAYGEYFIGRPKTTDLRTVLGVTDDQLTPNARYILKSRQLRTAVNRVSWAVRAYLQFQDLQSVTLPSASGANVPQGDILNQSYCYYESLAYLRESATCWVNGQLISALTLLRPMMELAVLHVYWKTAGSTEAARFSDWLRTGNGKPGFSRSLGKALENLSVDGLVGKDSRSRLYKLMMNGYRTLSQHVHGPFLTESLSATAHTLGGYDLENFLLYSILVETVMTHLVYIYILLYPMILFPVESHLRFGFAPPDGLFCDPRSGSVVTHFVGFRNVRALRKILRKSVIVQGALGFLDSTPIATREEVDHSWSEFCVQIGLKEKEQHLSDDRARLALAKSVMRTMHWMANYTSQFHAVEVPVSDQAVDEYHRTLRSWK